MPCDICIVLVKWNNDNTLVRQQQLIRGYRHTKIHCDSADILVQFISNKISYYFQDSIVVIFKTNKYKSERVVRYYASSEERKLYSEGYRWYNLFWKQVLYR